jgi:hypothetical protein
MNPERERPRSMTPHPATPARWFPPDEFYTEALCTRCGVCCGSTDGHPCEHLRREADGRYSCEIYEDRLTFHKTVDGRPFICVPIRKVIETIGGYSGCGYVEEIRRVRKGLGQNCSDVGRRKKP